MDLSSLLRLLGRQWFVVLTALLIAASSAYGAWVTADPTYTSDATVSVLPPRVNIEGEERNPYLDLSAKSNADFAQRLAIQMNGSGWRRSIRSQGLAPDYLVDIGDGTSPNMRVDVESDNADQADATLEAVIVGMGDELDSQQDRFATPDAEKFTLDVLDRSNRARQVFGNRTRLTIAVLVLGLGAAIAVAILADNLEVALRRRTRERRERELADQAVRYPDDQLPADGVAEDTSDDVDHPDQVPVGGG